MERDYAIIKWRSIDGQGFAPHRACNGDAGYDIYISEDIIIMPGSTAAVRTHLCIAPPVGEWWFMLTGRSSSRQKGLMVHQAVVDSGYRGELFIFTHNISAKHQQIMRTDRIAQLVPFKIHNIEWNECNELDDTERGVNGLGSTGN